MKKFLSVLLVAALMLTVFAGCSKPASNDEQQPADTQQEEQQPAEQPAEEPASSDASALTDGTYKAEAKDFDDHGWKATIEITVAGGKITEVKYDEVNKDNKKKSEDTEYHKNFKEQKEVDLLVAFDTLQKGLVEKQDPEKVDAYTGATGTTTSFKAMAKEALAGATGSAPASSDAGALKDGSYKAENKDFDDHGWKGVIEITVAGGKITEVKYDEVNKDSKKKSEDTEYHKNFKEKKDVDLLAAFDALQKGLVEKQDPEKVDTFTGATSGSDNFKALAKEALANAK